jgi:methionine--tRNA ligase beta chain
MFHAQPGLLEHLRQESTGYPRIMTESQTTTTTASSPEKPVQKPQIPFDDFIKLDLRVATVKSAEFHPSADRLLKVQLDDGTPNGRQVCAGIRQWYDPQSIVGKQVIIVANLEPRKIRGEISQGMILAASDMKSGGSGSDDPAGRDVILLTVDKPVKPGSVVS